MLRAFSDSKYKYSKLSCLNASRELLLLYLGLRSTNAQCQARVVDFSTAFAFITLRLEQVESVPTLPVNTI